jgi:hypothetical protein
MRRVLHKRPFFLCIFTSMARAFCLDGANGFPARMLRRLPHMTAAQTILHRVTGGEEMLRIFNVPCLKHFNRATVWRWAKAGKFPTIRFGRDYFTVASLVNECFADLNKTKADLKKEAKSSHEKAMEKLRKRGLVV